MLRAKKEDEDFNREIVVELTCERERWMRAINNIREFVNRGRSLEVWQEWGRKIIEMVNEEESKVDVVEDVDGKASKEQDFGEFSEILLQKEERDGSGKEKFKRYGVKVEMGVHGLYHSVLEYSGQTSDLLDLGKLVMTSQYRGLVKAAESRYDEMVSKEEKVGKLEERKLEEKVGKLEERKLEEKVGKLEERKLEEKGEKKSKSEKENRLGELSSSEDEPSDVKIDVSPELGQQSPE